MARKVVLLVLSALVLAGCGLASQESVNSIATQIASQPTAVAPVPTPTPIDVNSIVNSIMAAQVDPAVIAQGVATLMAPTAIPPTATPIYTATIAALQAQVLVALTTTPTMVPTVVAAPTAVLQVTSQAPAVQVNLTVTPVAVAPNVPTTQIWDNGSLITINFPQDPVSFAQLVALPCPTGSVDCVDLTIKQNALDYLKPERGEGDVVTGWYLSTERTGQRVFRWTVIRQPWAFPQFGWIHDGTIRTSCGLTSAESNALGYDKMDGATIPGMTAQVQVEGFSFYATQGPDLERLPRDRWTAVQRCPGILPELR